jgi:hypothetical protein
VPRADVQAIAAVNAERLIDRTDATRLREGREAAEAARLADRGVGVERREDAVAGLDPTSQRELRTGARSERRDR